MLRVKGALDACRLQPVSGDGYVNTDALALGGGPKFISKARASPCPRRDVLSFSEAAPNIVR